MADHSRLEYQHSGDVLVVRPLVRLLGPWEGQDPPPEEAIEFRDQLGRLLEVDAGPLLLDPRGFSVIRNWNWFLIPLLRECQAQGRPFATCVLPVVAGLFAITGLDQLLPIRTDFADALALLNHSPLT